MNMDDFKEKLIQMSKPEVSQLRHQEVLANAVTRAKDQSALSWWWLSIPLYLIAALIMKSFFMPQTSFLTNIHELEDEGSYSSLFFFLVLPIAFIVLNVMAIRKAYFLSGSPRTIGFLKAVWFNVLILLASLLILIIYAL